MTSEEHSSLLVLLRKLKDAKLSIPNMPLDIFYALNRIVPLPAVEVIITNTGKDFLLTKRKDIHWNGWHIPGGFIAPKETLENACKRIAKKELGIDIIFQEVITAYAWHDHPYASSISIVCLCRPKGIPKNGKFFIKIPKKMVKHHKEFIIIFRKKVDLAV